jgi:hypothetical protein
VSDGKGDTPRPKAVPESEYADNWARTFCPPLRDPATARDYAYSNLLIRCAVLSQRLVDLDRHHRATPCHDWPSRDALPSTEPEQQD